MIFQQKVKPGLSTKHQVFFFRLTKNHPKILVKPPTIVFVVLGVLRSFNKEHVENTWVKYVTLLLMMEEKILGFHRLQFCAEYRNLCFWASKYKTWAGLLFNRNCYHFVRHLSRRFLSFISSLDVWHFRNIKRTLPQRRWGPSACLFSLRFYELKTCARQK